MVRAFMISFVTRQAFTRSREELLAAYPHPWIVWEPGAWMAPAPNNRMTVLPPEPGNERPVAGDALCFELVIKPGQTGLKLGRAQDNDIVINDATVSRSHLLIAKDGGAWVALVSPSSRGVTANGLALTPGARVELRSGADLHVGEVQLTFLDAAGFVDRVKKAAGGT